MKDRPFIGAAVITGHALILALLFARGTLPAPQTQSDRLALFDVAPPPPPPPPSDNKPQAKAAPPARRAEPVPPPRPASVPTPAAVPSPPPAGSAEEPGPGSGAGGEETGTGSGGSGDGEGAGLARRARHLSGRIEDRDYPRAARRDRAQGTVVVAFTVQPDGRASGCATYRSSGNAALDETTCRLVVERFRFAPALDRQGRPIADEGGWRQDWWFER